MKYTFLILSSVFVSSCATICNRATTSTITSNPSGANLTITDKNKAVVFKGITPATVQLKASDGYFKSATYTLAVSKKGYPSQNMELRSEMSGWYLGNVVFGGLVGLLIVDPGSGKMWRMPDDYSVNLSPVATLDNGRGRKLAIIDHSRIPFADRKLMVPVSTKL